MTAPSGKAPAAAKIVLHAGCGAKDANKLHSIFRGPNWREIRLDADPAVRPDYIASITDLSIFSECFFDAVWSSHNLEHLYHHEVAIALQEFFRVLKHRGLALITLPDLQTVAERIAADRLDEMVYQSPAGPVAPLDMVYGFRPAVARGNPLMAHKTGFTATTLGQALRRAGFTSVKVRRDKAKFSLWVWAYKPGKVPRAKTPVATESKNEDINKTPSDALILWAQTKTGSTVDESHQAPMLVDPRAIDRQLDDVRQSQQKGETDAARKTLAMLVEQPIANHPTFQVLAGILLIQGDDAKQGRQLIDIAAKHRPETAAWASDLGFGLFLSGELDQALRALKRAVSLPDADATAFNRLGVLHLAQGNLEDAESALREALLRDPDRAEIHSNLGGVMVRLGKLESALPHFDRALALKPELKSALAGRGALLSALERGQEAVVELEERLELDPDSVPLRRHLAHILDAEGRFQEACAQLKEAVELGPNNEGARLQLAALYFDRGRFWKALQQLQQAAAIAPENIHILNFMARVYCEMGRQRQAETTVAEALALYPNAPASLITRALVRVAGDDYAGAETDLRRVLEILPGSAEAWGVLGHTLLLTGKLEEAGQCLERAADLNPIALAGLIEARRFPEDPKTIAQMIRFADNPLPAREPRAAMGFALARLFEKQARFDKAFAHARRANDLVKRNLAYDSKKTSRYIKRIKDNFTPELFDRFKEIGHPSSRPIFVVGMPRSGTTLCEQILASHPDVCGAGELGLISTITLQLPRVLRASEPYPLCMASLRVEAAAKASAYYLRNIAQIDPAAVYVVDKMPHNFMHLGLIALIFPNARIIHIRRDVRDIVISNYFTNFKNKHGLLGYAFDLADTGRMLNDYQMLMDYWRAFPQISLFELQYEDLVEDPEPSVRDLLKFLDLQWTDQVLAFHQTERAVKTASVWQVRQPLYKTSKARWKRYAEYLEPLIQVLKR